MSFLAIITGFLISSCFTWANKNHECGISYKNNATPWLVKVELVGRDDFNYRKGDFARCLGIVISSTNILTSSDCLQNERSKDLDFYELDVYTFKNLKGHRKRGVFKFLDSVYHHKNPDGLILGDYAVLNLKEKLPKWVPPICMIDNLDSQLQDVRIAEWYRKKKFLTTTSELVVRSLITLENHSLEFALASLNSIRNEFPAAAVGVLNGKWHLIAAKLREGMDEKFEIFDKSFLS